MFSDFLPEEAVCFTAFLNSNCRLAGILSRQQHVSAHPPLIARRDLWTRYHNRGLGVLACQGKSRHRATGRGWVSATKNARGASTHSPHITPRLRSIYRHGHGTASKAFHGQLMKTLDTLHRIHVAAPPTASITSRIEDTPFGPSLPLVPITYPTQVKVS